MLRAQVAATDTLIAVSSLVLDVFGSKLMPVVYGSILTAWGIAGIVGPQLVARITDRVPAQASVWSFSAGAGFLVIGFLAALGIKTGKLSAPSR